jgi:predicted nucleic acid-binding Zn ribbon protein
MRRKGNDQQVGEVIEMMLQQFGLAGKYREFRLKQSWAEMMGPMVANRTEDLYIRNGVMYVKLNSPSLRNELSYGRSKLVAMLNEAAGKEVIHDIRFQ